MSLSEWSLLTLGLGLGSLALWCALVLGQAIASHRWPHVRGQILSADLRPNTNQFLPGRVAIAVTYQYQVQGKTYTGERLSWTIIPPALSLREAHRRLRRYQVGEGVRVTYHPRWPGIATLRPGASASTWALGGFVLLLLMSWLVAVSTGVADLGGSQLSEN